MAAWYWIQAKCSTQLILLLLNKKVWKQICIPPDTGYSLKVYRFASAPFSYKINKVSLLLQILVFKAYLDLQTPLPKSLKNLRCTSRLDCHEDCDFTTLSFISHNLCSYICITYPSNPRNGLKKLLVEPLCAPMSRIHWRK